MKDFEKRKMKQLELQSQWEEEQKELASLKALMKERGKNAELATENASLSKYAFLIFGVITGMVLMVLCVRLL